MLNGIDITVSTVKRADDYLAATLESFSAETPICKDNPVTLVLGSPSAEHVTNYRTRPGIEIVEMGPSVWGWIQSRELRHRATWNYYRCLTHGSVGIRGSLVFEDDVQFACGWRERLDATIAQLESLYRCGFVLSLYNHREFCSKESKLFAVYEREQFYGTQGIYFPARVREGFVKYIKKRGVIANEAPYDILLRGYTEEAGVPIFATMPSLIQHTGKNSTGLGGWYFAPDFVEDVSVLPLV